MALAIEDLEAIKKAVRDAMAEKFEATLGIDCIKPESRVETRKDMEFLRALREGTRAGSLKIFWWIMGLAGTGALGWFWPQIKDHWK